ncbi:ankyrin [Amniculicola lignicola CBS 123094]|uniref:Ankyrin n=1 Tax=Amniculicola lignicola CBS 123094 TaxID=1392246 RepID=A0A6A5X4U9_9PLEO|nr:ankyrin [Amniculicola lignicola CBS 123094]
MEDTAEDITATMPERLIIADDSDAPVDDRPFDILSFLALYFARMESISQDVRQQILSSIFLDDRLLSRGNIGGAGGSFSVSIIESDHLERLQTKKHRLGVKQCLPEKIAMRVPKLSGSTERRENQRMLTAMAKEISVLTNKDIQSCDNIVTLLGACWSFPSPEKTILLPVLVYEAAVGDLDEFLLSHKNLPLGHQLQLCIDITMGVERLHRVGAVHCDLKPKNILVFPTGNPLRPFKAKIADFGCAILLDDIEVDTIPPPGTRFWCPPEQLEGRSIAKDELYRIDIFSLGLVILAIMTSNESTNLLLHLQAQRVMRPAGKNLHMGLDYFKRWGSLVMTGPMILERYSHLTVTERSSVKDPRKRYLPPELLDDDNCLNYSERWNAQATSFMYQALKGDIADRDITAREIASTLEGINISAEYNGQREHRRVDLDEVKTANGNTVSMSFVLEHESKEILKKADAWLIDPNNTSRVAMDRDFITNGMSPHMNTDYVLPRLQAAVTGEAWEYVIFGSLLEEHKHECLAVHKRVGAVVKLTNYLGNMSMLPKLLLNYVMQALDEVSSDVREPIERRTLAAFELSLALITYPLDESREDHEDIITRILQLFDFSVQNGHEESQWTIGWIYDTFNRTYPGENMDWLVRGMIVGSRIATKRLRKLDVDLYRSTRKLIKEEYQGIGEGWRVKPEYIQDNPVWYDDRKIPKANQIVLQAATGNIVKVKVLLDDGVDIDSIDGMQESSLIAACRSGHKEMVELLIESGADASHLSKENISALHFLSSFDEENIPYMALLLLAAGCPLDTHSTGHSSLNSGFTGADRFYGLVDGTPLLWAVAAGNLTAVKTLVDFGADPFDLDGVPRKLPISPVLWAAQMHQADILESLLDAPDIDVPLLLNDCFRESTTVGGSQVLPLAPTVSYSGGFVFYRVQQHGPLHREMCRRTIHMLLDKGADIRKVSTKDESAFHYAGMHGQPYGLEALLEWKGQSLKPDIKLWVETLIGSAIHEARGTFDKLLKMSVETNDDYSWEKTIAELSGSEDARYGKYYLNALITHHQSICEEPADYTRAFETALQVNNFENAKIVWNRADKIDIVCRKTHEDDGSSMTMLGRLLRRAIMFHSDLAQVKVFLELTGGREIVFDRVWADTDAGDYNALQVAMAYTPFYGTKQITTGVLETILMYFKHPTKHLNKMQGEKQKSLLHMAVRYGNVAAVELLLNVNGLDWSVRDSDGLTAFDRALNRLQDSWRDQELKYWEVPLDKLESAREEWEAQTRTMVHIMEARKCSLHSTYSHVFKRLSEEIVRRWMIFPDDGHIEVTDFKVSTFEKGDLLDRCKALPVGRCFYLALYADPEVTKHMSGGQFNLPEDVQWRE